MEEEILSSINEEEILTQSSKGYSSLITEFNRNGETVRVTKTDARNFIQPLLTDNLYKKYFRTSRGTFWPIFNRIFCCQSVLSAEAFQQKAVNSMYKDYAFFVQEYHEATNPQEKTELQEEWEEYFRTWKESEIKVFDKSGSRQHVQALTIMFLFYLQMVALILVGDVNYPEGWENTVSWLKQVFLPDIRIDLSIADSAALYVAFYLLVIVVHLLVYIIEKTKYIFFYSENVHLLLYISLSLIGIFSLLSLVLFFLNNEYWKLIIYYCLRDVIIPYEQERGEELYVILDNFFDRATKLLGVLSFNLITPLASVILNLVLNEENLVFKSIFSSIGFIILTSILYYYWKIGQEEKTNYSEIDVNRTKDVYRTNFQAYDKRFKWLLILLFIERILLTIVNRVFTNDTDLTGGWISLGILFSSLIFLYYYLPYKTKELNQIDILTRLSNIMVLSIGIVFTEDDSFSEDLVNIILFSISEKQFSLLKTFSYGELQKFRAKRRWKSVKTFSGAKKLLANRKKSGISEYEWSILSADQKVLFLCLDTDSNEMNGDNVETSEEVQLTFSSIHTTECFNTILSGKLFSSLKITSVELNSTGLTENAFSYILESNLFGRLNWLTSLEITNTKLSPTSNKNLFLSLLKGGLRLQKLVFFRCFTSSHNFYMFGEYLSQNTELQYLRIDDLSNFSPDSCKIILQSLNTKNLRELYLNINGFDDSHISLITDILGGVHVLEDLLLKLTTISKEEIISFHEFLSKLKLKQELCFSTKRELTIFDINEFSNTMAKNKNIFFSHLEEKIYQLLGVDRDYELLDKETWFEFSEIGVCDFSKYSYTAAKEGMNSIVSLALSLLNFEEKKLLSKNICSERYSRKDVSMKALIHTYATNRKKETLDAMYEVFGVEVFSKEELNEEGKDISI
eukprot:snap_masked-scaffold_53-processed-gene-1.80-mRNA-1 protein AED:1.00 eAED:1.00 QI:0/0/0/0/1/1/5/0/909